MAEKEVWQECSRRGGNTEFIAVLQSIGMRDGDEAVDDASGIIARLITIPHAMHHATAHLVAEHVQEFIRKRLNPRNKSKVMELSHFCNNLDADP